jgi:PST family polysaccharide transporter
MKIINNVGWLLGERVLKIISEIFIGIWIARYLGPEQFGLLSFVVAIVAIVNAIAALGLNPIVVRDLVKEPVGKFQILGTAFTLQLIAGVIGLLSVVGVVLLLRPGDNLLLIVSIILGFTVVFKSSWVIKYWFEAQVQSKYVVWVEILILLLVSIANIGMILWSAPLLAFVWVSFTEAVLAALALFIVYIYTSNGVLAWEFDMRRAKVLLGSSWPLIISGFAVILNMKIDIILVGLMMDDKSVGIYSAASRISTAWFFIPMIIAQSIGPKIIEMRNQENPQYMPVIQKLLDLMVLISLPGAILIVLVADDAIPLLFGPEYADAAKVLIIHVWSGIFVFLSVAAGRYMIAEEIQHLIMGRTLLGLVVNIVLNFVLIPLYGLTGAAIASLAGFAVGGFFANIFTYRTREIFWMQLKALFLPTRVIIGGFNKILLNRNLK